MANEKPGDSSMSASQADAWHEAVHAVVAAAYDFVIIGVDIIPQEIPGSGDAVGKAGADLLLPDLKMVAGKGCEAVLPILHTLLAGYHAERLVDSAAILKETHQASDGARVTQYAAAALFKTRAEAQRGLDDIVTLRNRAMTETESLVKRHEEAIGALASIIQEKGRIFGAEIKRFLSDFRGG